MSDSPTSVVCAGILVADVFVPPLPRLPSAGELLATDDFLLDTGGCAGNTAVGLAKLGVSVMAVGRVGSDSFGDFVARDLSRKGVNTAGIVRSRSAGTSKTIVLTVAGEDRRFIHTFGANAGFRAQDIPLDEVARARALYVGGYLVMPAVEPAPLAGRLRAAREQGVRTFLDVVVPAEDTSLSMDPLNAVLPWVDFFLPNQDEARALTGEADPRRQAERFLEAGCGTVIITLGDRGLRAMDDRQELEVGVYPIEFVDGSGAGDAFAAGVIAGVLEGWDLPDILRFASAVGASACTRLGCTPGVFTRAQADAFIQAHALEIGRWQRR